MSASISEEVLRVRIPARLDAAIEAESRRRMVTKSTLTRWILAERLGLFEAAERPDLQAQPRAEAQP